MSAKQRYPTLGADSITWLKGRAGAGGVRSVSEFLDQLVTAARQRASRSRHVGSRPIDIDSSDPVAGSRRRGAAVDMQRRSAARARRSRAAARYAVQRRDGDPRRNVADRAGVTVRIHHLPRGRRGLRLPRGRLLRSLRRREAVYVPRRSSRSARCSPASPVSTCVEACVRSSAIHQQQPTAASYTRQCLAPMSCASTAIRSTR